MPVINKIDLPNADPDTVKQQLELLFDIDPESVLLASAKTGLGIDRIFEEVVRRIPPPNRHGKLGQRLRFLLQVSVLKTQNSCESSNDKKKFFFAKPCFRFDSISFA